MKTIPQMLALALAVSSAATHAESKIEEVTITSSRTPVTLSEVLSSTTIITRQEIERVQAIDLYDLLNRTAGVSFVRNGGRGAATSLFLRGNQSDHTLILIDGVRTGSATLGSTSLNALNLASVERIELVRGPKSSLYGADAIGGVLNIITRKVEKPLELGVITSYGSNSTSENTLSIGASQGAFSAQLVANLFHTDGIDYTESKNGLNGDDDAYINKTLSFSSRFQPNENFGAQLSYNANDGETEYDANCGDALTFSPVDCAIYSTNFVDTLAFSVDWKMNDKLSARAQAGQSRDESEILADNIDLSSTYNGGEFNTKRRETTWMLNYAVTENVSVLGGVDYLDDAVTGSTNYDESSRYNRAAFIQAQIDKDIVDLSLSTRYDDNEQFGEEQTSSIQLGFALNAANRIVASYGEAFKAPTFNDLYYPFYGDPTFEPESSKSYELSYHANYEQHRLVVSAYQNDIKNLIQYNSTTFTTDQTAEAEITGLDIEYSADLSDWLFNVNANFLLPRNEVNDEWLQRRSRYKLAFDVDKSLNEKLSLGYSFIVEGARYDDVSNNTRLGGYALSNLRSEYRFSDEWSTRIRMNNVFDKRYATALDFSLGEYQNLGREFFVDIEFRPNF